MFFVLLPEPKHALQHDGPDGDEHGESKRSLPWPHAHGQQDGSSASELPADPTERADDEAAGRAGNGHAPGARHAAAAAATNEVPSGREWHARHDGRTSETRLHVTSQPSAPARRWCRSTNVEPRTRRPPDAPRKRADG